MATRKSMFPNYLNSPRIILYWEADEVKFMLGVIIFTFAVLFALNTPTPFFVVIIGIVTPVSYEGYKRLTKEAAPNWLLHFMYQQGLNNGVSKRFLINNGYDKDCDIIPPSFITVFED